MFENTYLYRIHWQGRYLGTISCYLAIFNFIYTTGRHFNEECMVIFSSKELWKISTFIETLGPSY